MGFVPDIPRFIPDSKGFIPDEPGTPLKPISFELGTGGVGEALTEPPEIPKIFREAGRELGGVTKAGILGGARAAWGFLEFAPRFVGKLGIAASEREGGEDFIYPGQPPQGGKPNIEEYEKSLAYWNEQFDIVKDAIFGSSQEAKWVEAGVSQIFEPINVAATFAYDKVMERTGDPALAVTAELGTLITIFRALPIKERASKAGGKIKARIETLRDRLTKGETDILLPKPPAEGELSSGEVPIFIREAQKKVDSAKKFNKLSDAIKPREGYVYRILTGEEYIDAIDTGILKPGKAADTGGTVNFSKEPIPIYGGSAYKQHGIVIEIPETSFNNAKTYYGSKDLYLSSETPVPLSNASNIWGIQFGSKKGIKVASLKPETPAKGELFPGQKKDFRLIPEEAPDLGDTRPEVSGTQPELIPGERAKQRLPERPPPAPLPEEGIFKKPEFVPDVVPKKKAKVGKSKERTLRSRIVKAGGIKITPDMAGEFRNAGLREGGGLANLFRSEKHPGYKKAMDWSQWSQTLIEEGILRKNETDISDLFDAIRENRKVYTGEEPTGIGGKWTKYFEAEERLAARVDEIIPEAQPEVGLSVRPIDVVQEKPKYKTEDYRFESEEIERRYNDAHGLKPPSIKTRAREILAALRNKASREFEHLPRTGEFAELRTALLKLAKQKGVSSDRTVRAIQGITINLDANRMGLFERKVLLDDLSYEVGAGHKLPLGFDSKTLAKEIEKVNGLVKEDPVIQESIKRRKEFSEEVKNTYIEAMESIGFNVGENFKNPNYFRHQVLEYANRRAVTGTGKRLRTPTGRSFLKDRKGSELDINTNYLEAEYEVLAQMLYDIEVAKTIHIVDREYNIVDDLKSEAAQKEKNWQDIIPEGYDTWQPREGNVFYFSDSIPAKLAEQLRSGALEEFGVTEKDLRQTLTLGGKRKQFVLKNEIIDTLDNLSKGKSEGVLMGLDRKLIGRWKLWQLVSPRRYLKYNFRNLTGDADAAFVGSPSVFRKTPQAVKELYQVFAADRAMTPEMREWFRRGGFETTFQAQELHELNRFVTFRHIRDRDKGVATIPKRAWKRYWEKATFSTNFRESILRYAAYLDYLEQMQKSPEGMPRNFGGSIPEEIRAIGDIRDRAFTLSNQLLGAYDQVGVMGNALRDHVYPFWSWKEVNFKRYIQFAKNASNDGNTAQMVGRKAVGSLAKTPATAYRVGKFLIKATAFWAMLQAWNHSMFPEEERELNVHTRNRPHIIFGRDENGEIINFTNIGALGDFLSWFGLDAFPLHVSNWMQGKRSLKEIAIEMAQSPVNVAVQGATPAVKIPGELLTGRQLFPDTFRPKTIRDRGYYLAQSFGLENEYKELMGLPSEGYNKSLFKFFLYSSDPGQNAFNDIYQEKVHFLEKIGKGVGGGYLSPKYNALYNLKLAIRYKDKDAVEKFSREYQKWGGTMKGLSQSVNNMHPLHGLNRIERIAFISSLSKGDRETLVRAIHFYTNILGGK